MKRYRTHIIVNHSDSRKINKLSVDNFKLILLPEPTTCYWESIDGSSYSHHKFGQDAKSVNKNQIPQNELIIECESEERAEDILSIIKGGTLLAYPDISLTGKIGLIEEYRKENDKYYSDKHTRKYFKYCENIGFGCLVANLAYNNKVVIYSIEKYRVSLELNSCSPGSVNPRFGQIFDHYDVKHNYHTTAAFAITSAFSVIEELGLEIRSSSKNKRFTNNETGEWNPKVLSNINKRLVDSGIATDVTFDWVYRGMPTCIEKEMKPFFGFDSQWVIYGEDVRDKTLTLPEAIHNASYLRNFIAAHKFNELTQHISPYDIFNVQSLARQMILLKMGLWQSWNN
ncbi:hypothetical protein L3049_03160 [Labilibaculum sp. DW002]|uniref:Uncharacterized protein n=1 Tax=Paralabilibaculum antarcticum TaxID=2912572 RepID=A0ABT5VNI4_9BACT|nr:hypothetical protein [Labilibaculum sp. DW002]MDE5416994.1 hypothetical protein [Labilibaculum sp. DW002]